MDPPNLNASKHTLPQTQQREQLCEILLSRGAAVGLRADVLKLIEDNHVDRLLSYRSESFLRVVSREGLKDAGLPSYAIDVILALKELPKDNLESFKYLLAKGGIQRPIVATLNRIVQHYSNRLMFASTVDTALQLYEDVRNLPGTSTEQVISTQNSLTINGPLFPNMSTMLLGVTDSMGVPRVLKLLGGNEENACRKLCIGKPEDIPLVEAQVITFRIDHQTTATACHGPGLYSAVLMPQYPTALVLMAPLPLCALLAGVKRMAAALDYIHGKGLVHMDVKAANIFVSMDGRWWLGDFGSTVAVNEKITSTTKYFCPKPPKEDDCGAPELDWYMLVVAIVIEVLRLQGKPWRETLVTQTCTPWEKLEVTMRDIQRDVPGSSDLLSYLNDLLKRVAG